MAKRIIWSPNALADRIRILDYWFQRIGTKTYCIRIAEGIQTICAEFELS
jgi:plasmid stabilization system protein ParE